jgi:hypothetical protein
MFCIFHRSCRSKVGDNGNCSVYPNSRVTRVNAHLSECCFLKPTIYAFEKEERIVKKRNPLKASKKGGS